jgi:hypothetical protein
MDKIDNGGGEAVGGGGVQVEFIVYHEGMCVRAWLDRTDSDVFRAISGDEIEHLIGVCICGEYTYPVFS